MGNGAEIVKSHELHWKGHFMNKYDFRTEEGKAKQQDVKQSPAWRKARDSCLKALDDLVVAEGISVQTEARICGH